MEQLPASSLSSSISSLQSSINGANSMEPLPASSLSSSISSQNSNFNDENHEAVTSGNSISSYINMSEESEEMSRHNIEISNKGSKQGQSNIAAAERNNKAVNKKRKEELREKMITYLAGYERYFVNFIHKLIEFLKSNKHDFKCINIDERRISISKVVSKPGENECILSEMEKIILEMYEKANNYTTFFQNILGKYANRTQRFQVKEASLENMDGKFKQIFDALNSSMNNFTKTYQESKEQNQHGNHQNAVTEKLERVMTNFKQVQEPIKYAETYFPAQ